MSVQKHLNSLINGFSYLRASVSGRPVMAGMPLALGIELTNLCNLNCPECASGAGLLSRDKGYMDLELFKKIIAELRPFLFNVNLFFQGEPMLHPEFFSFIEALRDLTLTVSTNGHFLDKPNSANLAGSGLKKLIVSVDGMDQEAYAAYRAEGSLAVVLNGIKNISEAIRNAKSPLRLELQFLVNKMNEHQIPLARSLAAKSGATLRLKSMQIINPVDADKWLPEDERFRRYRSVGGAYILKNKYPNSCYRLWSNPVVTWDGLVVPCCFDKDADYKMGDLNDKTFREIWFGEKYIKFRNTVFTKRSSLPICRNCTSSIKGVNV